MKDYEKCRSEAPFEDELRPACPAEPFEEPKEVHYSVVFVGLGLLGYSAVKVMLIAADMYTTWHKPLPHNNNFWLTVKGAGQFIAFFFLLWWAVMAMAGVLLAIGKRWDSFVSQSALVAIGILLLVPLCLYFIVY